MSRKLIFLCLCRFPILLAGILFLCSLQSRVQAQGYNTLDPTTQKSLNEVRQLLLMGETEKVEELVRRIINGSGYINPLAEIYYKLAQNENEIEPLISHYTTIMENWENSPWSAKAIVDLVPIILMSGGRLNDHIEGMIWYNQEQWLSAASQAAAIGDDPKLLQEEVALSLLELAHARGNVEQVKNLAPKIKQSQNQDKAQLALAYSKIRLQQKDQAVQDIQLWLQNYSQSSLRPFAWLALFHAAQAQETKHEAVNNLLSKFEDTLEGKIIKRYISIN